MYNSSHIIYLQTSLLCLIMSEGQRSSFRRSGPGNSGGLNITLAGISTKMKQVHLGSMFKAKQLSSRCLGYLTSTIARHDITLFCGLVFEGTTLRSSICSCKSLELKSNKIKLVNDHDLHMHIYIYLNLSWKKIWLSIFIPKDNFMTKKQNDNLNIHGWTPSLVQFTGLWAKGPCPLGEPGLGCVCSMKKKRTKIGFKKKIYMKFGKIYFMMYFICIIPNFIYLDSQAICKFHDVLLSKLLGCSPLRVVCF